jgi:CRISPR-associated protein Cpf1
LEYNPANFKDINFPIKKYKVVIKGERIRWDNINKKNSYFDLEDMVNDLFLKYKVDQNKNISDQIRSGEYDSDFYKSLFFIINLALQLRNSDSEKEIDYLICPACGFHSKDGFQNNIYNADANGAYNIARKGIMILNKIKEFKKKNNNLEKLKWSDLIVKNEEWDKFTQK